MTVKERIDFESFTLVYLAGSGSDFELELTINKGQDAPYELGNGYGHLAFAVDNLEATHAAVKAAGHAPRDIVEFRPDGENLLAKFFFIADPDGYQIEVLQASGRYQ
jgi:lactoylglutathione lyase